MIICDHTYLKELERRMKRVRWMLPLEVADAIDCEIEAIEAQGDPWYSKKVMADAFRITHKTLGSRTNQYPSALGVTFQGHLPSLPLRHNGAALYYGTWFDAASVNKDTFMVKTWRTPDEMIVALSISHRLHRYQNWMKQNHGARCGQNLIDKWRIENGNEKVLE